MGSLPLRPIIAGVLLLLCAYGLIKAWPLLSGPVIRIDTLAPADDASGALGFITLSGQALHTETLLLNGGTLLIDEHGNFSKTLTLPSGSAILSLTATDRFGRSRSIQRTVETP